MITWKRRMFSLIIMLLFLVTACSPITENIQQNAQIEEGTAVEIHFIDTGNSDCILICDNGKYMLIDGADNDDEKMLVEYLKKLNIKHIDYVVLTHPDADHCGGLDAIINHFNIGQVFIGNGDAQTKTYNDFVQAAIDKDLLPSVPLEDKTFTLGRGKFKFYNQKSTHKDVNDNSLVALYTIGSHKFLFMGDAGKEVETELPLREIGQIDVLKVGHHGSKTSTSDSFIKAIAPKYSVICSGEDNKYGHPHQEPLDILNKYKSEIVRTDINGNIVFISDGEDIEINYTQAPLVAKDSAEVSNAAHSSAAENISKIVYLTDSGQKYHALGCSYLNKGKIESTLEPAKLQGYEACKVCKP